MVATVPPVVQNGATVQVDAVALPALVYLHEAPFSHRIVVLRHGAPQVARSGAIAVFVAMDYQSAGCQAEGQDVVGQELVQQVVLVGVACIVCGFGIGLAAAQKGHHVLYADVQRGLSNGGAPH